MYQVCRYYRSRNIEQKSSKEKRFWQRGIQTLCTLKIISVEQFSGF